MLDAQVRQISARLRKIAEVETINAEVSKLKVERLARIAAEKAERKTGAAGKKAKPEKEKGAAKGKKEKAPKDKAAAAAAPAPPKEKGAPPKEKAAKPKKEAKEE
jgi:hypothetical protein